MWYDITNQDPEIAQEKACFWGFITLIILGCGIASLVYFLVGTATLFEKGEWSNFIISSIITIVESIFIYMRITWKTWGQGDILKFFIGLTGGYLTTVFIVGCIVHIANKKNGIGLLIFLILITQIATIFSIYKLNGGKVVRLRIKGNSEAREYFKKETKKAEQYKNKEERLYCRFCGEKIPSDSLYCQKCGRNIR